MTSSQVITGNKIAIGKGTNSGVWHLLRRPYHNEGMPKDRVDPNWQMSLCSMVWKITRFRAGTPTCQLCLRRLPKALKPLAEIHRLAE